MAILNHSLAYNRFKKNHTDINIFYWQAILTRKIAERSTSFIPGNIKFVDFLCDPRHNAAFDFQEWKGRTNDLENWVRLNTLLASNSYFERYIYEITATAFMKTPSLLDPSTSKTGLSLLKSGIDFPRIKTTSENFTRGEWITRVNNIINFFPIGHIITPSEINKLEVIRRFRNRVAHSFGTNALDLQYPNQFIRGTSSIVLHEPNLKDYLELFHYLAEKIDNEIFSTNVGNFELQILWHDRDLTRYPRQSYIEQNCVMMKKLIVDSYNVSSFRRRQLMPVLREYESIP